MKQTNVINLKTYKSGVEALSLAKQIEKADKSVIIGVQATELKEISSSVKNPIFVQHVEYLEPGRNTGFILPEAVKKNGARGVFLNHSEHPLEFDVLKKTVIRCRTVGLKTLIFASDLKSAIKIKSLKPDYLVIEPPELVAGKISVSTARPDLIEKISKKLKYPFLVGAGVKTNGDLKVALKFGASGIAVSSAITTAKDPKRELKGLLGKK